MPTLLQKMTHDYYSSGLQPKTTAARAWFMDHIQHQSKGLFRPANILEGEASDKFSMLGNMFFFMYDAKWKDKLPYWDKFPLVIPMEFYRDSFLGINLHYLPYMQRAVLLDKLVEVSQIKGADQYKRFKVRYDTIKEASKFREVKPCIKKYLYPHIRSKFVKVQPDEWEVAIFLPVQRFVGPRVGELYSGA